MQKITETKRDRDVVIPPPHFKIMLNTYYNISYTIYLTHITLNFTENIIIYIQDNSIH